MDAKHIEETPATLSPGINIKASLSHNDSDSDTLFNNSEHGTIEMDKKNEKGDGSTTVTTISSIGSSSTGSGSSNAVGEGVGGVEEADDEGFVSGEEDFEPGSARSSGFNGTLVGPMAGDDSDEPLLNFSTPRVGIPIANVSLDEDDYDDDDDDGAFVGAGPPKVRVLGGDEEVLGEGSQVVGVVDSYGEGLGLSEAGNEGLNGEEGKALEKQEIEQSDLEDRKEVTLDRDETKVCPVVEETSDVSSGVNESSGVKFTSAGDTVVEAISIDVVEVVRSGVAIIGQVSQVEKSENKATESLVVQKLSSPTPDTETDETKVSLSEGTEASIGGVVSSNLQSVEADDAKIADDGDSDKVNVKSLLSEAAISGLIVNLEKSQTGDVNATNEPPQQMNENENVKQVVSEVDGEGTKKADNVDDATETISAVGHGLKEYVSDMLELLAESPVPSGAISGEIQAEGDGNIVERQGEIEGSATNGENEDMIFGGSAAARQFMEELVQASKASLQTGENSESSFDPLRRIEGQVVTDSDEEADSDEEGGEELLDSAALAALLKAARSAGSDSDPVTITSQDGSRLFTIERPAGLGSSLSSARTASRPNSSSILPPPSHNVVEEENLSEEEKKKIEKIQELRVKFLRLVHRLGRSAEDSIASQVFYRLALLAGRPSSQIFSFDEAKQAALRLEAEKKDDLNFSLNILVLGKTGVGKSATINSILGEEKVSIDAFEPATASVKEINGVVDGVKIRFFDTPGLKSSGMEQGYNSKLLASVKKFTKNSSPDIVLYVDRLDSQTRDLNDLPLLRTITSSLGSSVWRNAIVTLTHAASAPPDGPTGSPLSYEAFVAQRSHIVQQYVGQAVGEMRFINPSLMNPVSLVENHPACRKTREGHKVLPNGQTWRPQLLLLCYAMKILSEASSLSKPQDSFDPRKLFGIRSRIPSLPYFLSSLLQSRAHPKLPAGQGVDNGDSDIDLADFSDSDVEEDEEYDQLPPFKPLKRSQVENLSKEQRRAYLEEYDYRVKVLQKKQWKEELRRMRDMKKRGSGGAGDYGQMPEDVDPENGAPSTVQVPMPDMVLPPTFDGDNPAYRYRFLEPKSHLLARPVLDSHGWDHDCGYDGVNIESNIGIAGRFPSALVLQVTKDKKEFNVHLDSSVSAKHGDNGSSLAGFDIQAVGKQLAYVVRGETELKTLKKNKTAAGVSVTFLGENVATGVKVEDQLAVGKRLVLVGSAGTVRAQREAAYGANLEVRLRAADFPIGQDQSSFVLSLIRWRGDLALGANLQSQFSVGRGSKMAVRVSLNNKYNGQITVRTSSSDHLQLALAGLIPIAAAVYRIFRPEPSESHSFY